jgi:hypothetical protein
MNFTACELNDKEKIKEAFKEVRLSSVFWAALKRNYEEMPIADAYANIISEMKEFGVKRVLTLATPNVKVEKDKKSFGTLEMSPFLIRATFL